MKEYTINKEKYKELKEKLNNPYSFICDGCNCGDFEFQLEDNLYLSIYRSCHKANATPSNMYWKIHEINLYKLILETEDEFRHTPILDIGLNEIQSKEIMDLAKLRSSKDIGYDEYGNEYEEEIFDLDIDMFDSLENTEQSLLKLNIKIKDDNNNYKPFNTVIEELSNKYKEMIDNKCL